MCVDRETYYVKGVEKMGVAFEHAYKTTEKVNGGLAGSSAVLGEKLEQPMEHRDSRLGQQLLPRHLCKHALQRDAARRQLLRPRLRRRAGVRRLHVAALDALAAQQPAGGARV